MKCNESKRRRRVEAGTRRGNGDAGNQCFWNGVEGVFGYPDGEGHRERGQVKSSRSQFCSAFN